MTEPHAAPTIELEHIRFSFPGGAFGLSVEALRIEPGERIACIGASGTGKTTLVNLISGILLPSAGSVRLGEHDLTAMGESSRRALRIAEIGMVFQEFELLPYLSALENILLPYHVSRMPLDRAARDRAGALAEAAGISHTLSRRPRRLSQGERQRVAICRALVASPGVIICDEPTGNLDPNTSKAVLDLLFDQVREHAATLLMVTHNHAILDRFDRVIDIEQLNNWPGAAS